MLFPVLDSYEEKKNSQVNNENLFPVYIRDSEENHPNF